MTLTTVEDVRAPADDPPVAGAGADGWTQEPIAAAPDRLVLALLIGGPASVLAAAGLLVIWRYG